MKLIFHVALYASLLSTCLNNHAVIKHILSGKYLAKPLFFFIKKKYTVDFKIFKNFFKNTKSKIGNDNKSDKSGHEESVKQKNSWSSRNLQEAITNLDVISVDKYIEGGADVNEMMCSGSRSCGGIPVPDQTPLIMTLCRYPKTTQEKLQTFAIVKKLLAAGADPNLEVNDLYPINLGVHHDLKIVKVLLEYGAQPRLGSLHCAVNYDRPEIVKKFISLRISPNQLLWRSYDDNFSALHQACEQGSYKSFMTILQNGGDANGRTSDGRPPLHVLIKEFRSDQPKEVQHDMMKQLFLYGADPKATYKDETPLDYAIRLKKTDIVELLKQLPSEKIEQKKLKIITSDY